jgi:hypothetical protein
MRASIEEALAELPSPKTVVLEAGRSSYYMAGLLESMVAEEEVWIVDPGEVRRLQHAVSTADHRDAAALAWWAANGVLEAKWRPDAQTTNLKGLMLGSATLAQSVASGTAISRADVGKHRCQP